MFGGWGKGGGVRAGGRWGRFVLKIEVGGGFSSEEGFWGGVIGGGVLWGEGRYSCVVFFRTLSPKHVMRLIVVLLLLGPATQIHHFSFSTPKRPFLHSKALRLKGEMSSLDAKKYSQIGEKRNGSIFTHVQGGLNIIFRDRNSHQGG